MPFKIFRLWVFNMLQDISSFSGLGLQRMCLIHYPWPPRVQQTAGDTRLVLVFPHHFFLSSSWSWNSDIYYIYVRLALRPQNISYVFSLSPRPILWFFSYFLCSRKKGAVLTAAGCSLRSTGTLSHFILPAVLGDKSFYLLFTAEETLKGWRKWPDLARRGTGRIRVRIQQFDS